MNLFNQNLLAKQNMHTYINKKHFYEIVLTC